MVFGQLYSVEYNIQLKHTDFMDISGNTSKGTLKRGNPPHKIDIGSIWKNLLFHIKKFLKWNRYDTITYHGVTVVVATMTLDLTGKQ